MELALVSANGEGEGIRLMGLGVLDEFGWCNEMLKGDLKVGLWGQSWDVG